MILKQTVWDIETDKVFSLTILLDHLIGSDGQVIKMVELGKGGT